MTPKQLARALDALHWSNHTLASELGCDEKTVRNWRTAIRPVPPLVVAWLAELAEFHRSHPAPAWRMAYPEPE